MREDKKRYKIIREIIGERSRQDFKWGEQNHNPHIWLSILMEEVGEASEQALNIDFGLQHSAYNGIIRKFRKEIIEVTAVGLAIIECLDRDKWRKSPAEKEAKE